jgi:molecular chaperone GrpE
MSQQENDTVEETGVNEETKDASKESEVVSSDINLEEELNKAKVEIASLRDSWARERAEFQNYKRRTASEFFTVKRDAVKNFVIKILTPIDNLDRVTKSVNVIDELKPFVDGVKMIQNEFSAILERENIVQIKALGEAFDPMRMEAIASEESEEYTEEIVIEVYQPGYEFKESNDSFPIRPPRVRVGRPKI